MSVSIFYIRAEAKLQIFYVSAEYERNSGVLRNRRVVVTTIAEKVKSETKNEISIFALMGREGKLEVRVKSNWKITSEIFATGDSRLGKGVLGAIPVHLIFQSAICS